MCGSWCAKTSNRSVDCEKKTSQLQSNMIREDALNVIKPAGSHINKELAQKSCESSKDPTKTCAYSCSCQLQGGQSWPIMANSDRWWTKLIYFWWGFPHCSLFSPTVIYGKEIDHESVHQDPLCQKLRSEIDQFDEFHHTRDSFPVSLHPRCQWGLPLALATGSCWTPRWILFFLTIHPLQIYKMAWIEMQ
jgi:hypothetical protein